MSIVINTNVASLNVQRNLLNSANALSTSITRLSSGLRINSADSGISIATKPQQASELSVAYRNADDAMSLAQTAEGGLNDTGSLLSRMRQLTAQSLNDTLTADHRDALQQEFSNLKSEIFRIAGGTSFGSQKLFELDSGTPRQITVGTAQLDLSDIALISNDETEDGILTRSDDRISLKSDAFDISGSSSREQRLGVLDALDKMLSDVNTARHALGVFQGEVYSDMEDIRGSVDPGIYTPTGSRAFDSDFASETVNVRDLIKQQAASSVLAQANNMPQIALSLLRG